MLATSTPVVVLNPPRDSYGTLIAINVAFEPRDEIGFEGRRGGGALQPGDSAREGVNRDVIPIAVANRLAPHAQTRPRQPSHSGMNRVSRSAVSNAVFLNHRNSANPSRHGGSKL
jgi:hypothetical protein